jgi:hypothetical protein
VPVHVRTGARIPSIRPDTVTAPPATRTLSSRELAGIPCSAAVRRSAATSSLNALPRRGCDSRVDQRHVGLVNGNFRVANANYSLAVPCRTRPLPDVRYLTVRGARPRQRWRRRSPSEARLALYFGLVRKTEWARHNAQRNRSPMPMPQRILQCQHKIRFATSLADPAAPSVPIVPGGVQPSPTL